MNGEIGKLIPGAGYPATPESFAAVGSSAPGLVDYTVMNGGPPPGGELMLDTGVGNLEPLPQQLAMGMGGAVGYAPLEMTPLNDVPVPPSQIVGEHSESNMPLDQLKQMLSSQLEYYFSRENLANDTYLLSQMDNDQYVPIWTVANFNQVKKLTKDIKLITEVLRESPNVQVDEEGQKVRPNHKRCIVILREIPQDTPIEEVKNIFSGENCPRFISCEFAHNNAWYVTFESDEDAQKAYRFLREEVKEFQGKPIMARIKAKPMNRLPIPAVSNVGGMKNGYRTPTPQPVYDPASYQPGQQRFLYTNGTAAMPQTAMPYPNPVHVYHQPFYPAGMVPWGAPANPAAYAFDMSVFTTMNGIASHNSFKPHSTRYNQRNSNTYSRNKQRNGSERGGTGLIDSGGNMVPMARTSHSHPALSGGGPVPLGVTAPALPNILPGGAKPVSSSYSTGTKFQPSHTPNVVGETQYPSGHANKGSHQESDNQAQESGAVQYPRHRTHRRTKDPESQSKANSSSNSSSSSSNPMPSIRETSGGPTSTTGSNTQHSRGVQFDLEAAAFPPLPGLDAAASKQNNSSSETTNPESTQSQNRLSDVVKGTAKLKSTNKDKELHQHQHQQQPTAATAVSSQFHHQQFQQQHHPHSHVHHQQQQQQHHHHHHHHHQAVISSHSSRSTSPGNQSQQQREHPHQQRLTSESAVGVNATSTPTVTSSSSTAAATSPPAAVAAAAAAAANSNALANAIGESEIALGTLTLTPPSSPDKFSSLPLKCTTDRSIKTDDSSMVNGVDEAAAGIEDCSKSVTRCDCDSVPTPQKTRDMASTNSTDITRPSYAQVAQHSRDQPCSKHKNDEKDRTT